MFQMLQSTKIIAQFWEDDFRQLKMIFWEDDTNDATNSANINAVNANAAYANADNAYAECEC